MEYSVGDTLRVDGTVYDIIGKIQYKNLSDNCCWFEYRMIAKEYKKEKWLSCDDKYHEYSISAAAFNLSTSGYHLVDSGTEKVIGAWGDVDVVIGDQAVFKEYEDSTEEKILSSETWDDGEELSIGYYLDLDEINFYSADGTIHTAKNEHSSNHTGTVKSIVYALIVFVLLFGGKSNLFSGTSITKYLKKSTQYSYTTSITGNQKQKADVYKSFYDLDYTVKDILNAIEGKTVDVQQNTEDGDNSVAILTDKEYCLIYISEDGEVLIQISTRKYAYGSDNSPHRSSAHTRRYYKRYYYSKGYASDYGTYEKYTSPYSSYDDTFLDSNASDTYNTYSSSVRQSSVNSRKSPGGGLSSGK